MIKKLFTSHIIRTPLEANKLPMEKKHKSDILNRCAEDIQYSEEMASMIYWGVKASCSILFIAMYSWGQQHGLSGNGRSKSAVSFKINFTAFSLISSK